MGKYWSSSFFASLFFQLSVESNPEFFFGFTLLRSVIGLKLALPTQIIRCKIKINRHLVVRSCAGLYVNLPRVLIGLICCLRLL